MNMRIEPIKIADAYRIRQKAIADDRGRFSRLFCLHELTTVLQERQVKQVNFSQTDKIGTVRGLHFQQSPYDEMKLVRCVSGEVWDVIVDLRPDSPTFLQWHAEMLSPQNAVMMVVPEGCAHGFQCLQPNSEMVYFHTAFYTPEAELGVNVTDPELAIAWPLPINGLSQRDQQLPMIQQLFAGVNQ